MNTKRILITGGSGFVGKNLIEVLSLKYNITSLSHEQLDLTKQDSVNNFFKRFGPFDVIIHSANLGGKRNKKDGADVTSDNLRMFYNILSNSAHYKKMISFGSGSEYAKNRPIINIAETKFGEVVPQDYYGFSKYVQAKYIETQKNITNLRIFGLFGKYEDSSFRFISYSILRNLKRLPIIINQNVFFDYVLIDDFINIVDYFIKHDGKFESYNIGSGHRIDLVEISKIINGVSGFESKIIIKKNGYANEYTCNISRLKKEILPLSFTPMEQSIKKLFEYYTR